VRALLDVNVLIALLDAAHIHHQRASQWLEQALHHGWASCPLTQNGCLRIMAQPAYPQALPLAAVAQGGPVGTPVHCRRLQPAGCRQLALAATARAPAGHGCVFVGAGGAPWLPFCQF